MEKISVVIRNKKGTNWQKLYIYINHYFIFPWNIGDFVTIEILTYFPYEFLISEVWLEQATMAERKKSNKYYTKYILNHLSEQISPKLTDPKMCFSYNLTTNKLDYFYFYFRKYTFWRFYFRIYSYYFIIHVMPDQQFNLIALVTPNCLGINSQN